MRWLREFFRPALRCARVGHRPRSEYRRGFVRPNIERGEHRTYVVMEVVQHRGVCSRCKIQIEPWLETKRTGIHGFTCSQQTADEIDRTGAAWIEHGGGVRY